MRLRLAVLLAGALLIAPRVHAQAVPKTQIADNKGVAAGLTQRESDGKTGVNVYVLNPSSGGAGGDMDTTGLAQQTTLAAILAKLNATIGVTGTVAVSGTVPVSGTVAVSNFPAATGLTDEQLRAMPVPVMGSVTAAVTGAVEVTNQPAPVPFVFDPSGFLKVAPQGTQSVSGTVAVSNFPATVAVSNFPSTTPGLTDAELRAAPVSVSGSVTVANPTTSVTVSNLPATQPVSGTVSVGNFPATQGVSGSVSVSNFPSSPYVIAGRGLDHVTPVVPTVHALDGDHFGMAVMLHDAAGQALTYRKENENWMAADTGVLMYGRDTTVSPNKYRALALDDEGHLGIHLRRMSDNVEIGTPAAPIRIDPTGTTTQPVSGSISITGTPSVSVTNWPSSTTVPFEASPGHSLGTAVAGHDGTYSRRLKTNANGELQVGVVGTAAVSLASVPTHAVTQSGTWSVRAQDGSGNALLSNTAQPAAGDRGLVVRNIPTGTQNIAGTGTAGTPVGGVLSVQGVASGVALPVSGTFWQATQPVSAAALPLPAGAATEATLSAVNTKLGGTLATRGTKATSVAKSTAVSVSTTAVALPASALANRTSLCVRNNGSLVTYLGGSDVTTANGFPLAAGATYCDDVGASVLYAISTGANDVRLLEQ